ncbi:hypothetical protein PAERUG_E5_London_17_VIM_2_12_12_04074 [Pseudomonas aeruginosa]|nr:hypothetical protein PAERUG_E5_London_17_VIM_2_12_12_04074 [Pseudomonas aeruginosa]
MLAVRQGGGGIGQDHLRFVQLGALQGAQAAHLIHRQFAEQGEEATDVAIIAVAPELPEVERRQALGVEPYRTLRRLAHLAPVTGGQQRHGQAEQLGAALASRQLHAVDDVRPLVGAAELQGAAAPARQFDEIVGLQQGVAELEERQRMLAVQALPDGVEGQQAVDREVPADPVEELQVADAVQPFGVVHQAVVVQFDVARENPGDAVDIGLDLRLGEDRPARIAEARIADPGGRATDQQQRAVPGLL